MKPQGNKCQHLKALNEYESSYCWYIYLKTYFRQFIYSYEINYSPAKYIETSEGGLVIISVNEGDGGRYDSYLDGTLLCSYSVNVDAHRWVEN